MIRLNVALSHTVSVNARELSGTLGLTLIDKGAKSKTVIVPTAVSQVGSVLTFTFEHQTKEGGFYYLIIENDTDTTATESAKHVAFCTDQINTPYKSVTTISGLQTF